MCIPADAGDVGTNALGPVIEFNLTCRLTFDARLDAEVLARAVRLVLDAEPVLGCRLTRGIGRAVWERSADLDSALPFEVVLTGDPDHQCTAFHDEAIGSEAPRFAARLCRSPYEDDLCLKVDHRAADGRGAKELVYLVAETYSRLLADAAYAPRPSVGPRPSYDDLWEALTPEQRTAAEAAPRFATNRWKIPLRAGDEAGLRVGTLTLFPCGLEAVKAYGKARGATVNDMLVTALLRSIARTSPPAEGIPLGISITADLRRYAPDPRFARPCNLSSAQTVEIGYDANDGFDEALRRVIDGIRPWKAGLWGFATLRRPGLPTPVVTALMSAVMAYAGRQSLVPPTVMNIGVLDEQRLTFGDRMPAAAHILGPVLKAPGLAAVVTTYRGELTACLAFREELVATGLVERALRGMDEELREQVWCRRRPGRAEVDDSECVASCVRVRRATVSAGRSVNSER